jgi:hypothetical protein
MAKNKTLPALVTILGEKRIRTTRCYAFNKRSAFSDIFPAEDGNETGASISDHTNDLEMMNKWIAEKVIWSLCQLGNGTYATFGFSVAPLCPSSLVQFLRQGRNTCRNTIVVYILNENHLNIDQLDALRVITWRA